eukprot:396756-Rhodomonas_salina.2
MASSALIPPPSTAATLSRIMAWLSAADAVTILAPHHPLRQYQTPRLVVPQPSCALRCSVPRHLDSAPREIAVRIQRAVRANVEPARSLGRGVALDLHIRQIELGFRFHAEAPPNPRTIVSDIKRAQSVDLAGYVSSGHR